MRRSKYSFEPRGYKGKIKNRITIDERPEIINQRKRLGNFEIDLIVGPKNKGAILTVVDRLSKRCIIEKLSSKNAKEIKAVLLTHLTQKLVAKIICDKKIEEMIT